MAVSSRMRRTQLGREVTAGTAVAATTYWTGPTTKTDGSVITIVQEAIGQYADRGTTYLADLGVQGLTMENHPLNLEEILHIFEAGVDEVTPTGNDPYTYEYILPGGSTDAAVQTYTIEAGDSVQAEEMAYCIVTSFTISGGKNAALMAQANWQGRQWGTSTFTGALTVPTVEPIIFNTGALYLDDSGGTVGTTQVSSSFTSFTLTVQTGLGVFQTADGNLYFTAEKRINPSWTLAITAEHTSDWNISNERGNFRNRTMRLVQCDFTGTSSRQLTIDGAGIWTSFSDGDADGNAIINATMQGVNSSTDSLFLTTTIINGLASVP